MNGFHTKIIKSINPILIILCSLMLACSSDCGNSLQIELGYLNINACVSDFEESDQKVTFYGRIELKNKSGNPKIFDISDIILILNDTLFTNGAYVNSIASVQSKTRIEGNTTQSIQTYWVLTDDYGIVDMDEVRLEMAD